MSKIFERKASTRPCILRIIVRGLYPKNITTPREKSATPTHSRSTRKDTTTVLLYTMHGRKALCKAL